MPPPAPPSLAGLGERATIRARSGIVIVITHRRSVLGEVDLLLAIVQGRVVAMGPREVVFQKLMRPTSPIVEPFKVVPTAG